jgi:hypothetical protein
MDMLQCETVMEMQEKDLGMAEDLIYINRSCCNE